jgi:opacity protein-like surface antigen
MKQFLLAAAVLTASLSAPASAADLARPRAHAVYGPAVAFYNWTGCYVGGNGGETALVRSSHCDRSRRPLAGAVRRT